MTRSFWGINLREVFRGSPLGRVSLPTIDVCPNTTWARKEPAATFSLPPTHAHLIWCAHLQLVWQKRNILFLVFNETRLILVW